MCTFYRPNKIVKIGAVILNAENKLLTGRKRGCPDPKYILIGGKPEGGENHLDTLKREIWEEIGVTVNSFTEFGHFCDKSAFEDADIEMYVYEVDVCGLPRACSEIEDIQWIGEFELASGVALGSVIEKFVIPRLREQKRFGH